MSIDGVGGVTGASGPGQVGDVQGRDRPGRRIPLSGRGEGRSFQETLGEALDEVSGLQEDARSAIRSFVRGEPVEVHQVMAAAEEAGIALEMLIEVRNKLTEAYRSVINMRA